MSFLNSVINNSKKFDDPFVHWELNKPLTEEQINANVKLIYYLTQKYPSIEFLFGHLEYMNIRYPHYKYYTAYDKTYEPPIKIDPGWDFMRVVRSRLSGKYNISLKR